MRFICWTILFALLLPCTMAVAGPPFTVPKPGLRDLCPVCGMIVAKYPEWTATVVWNDAHAHHFDGAKDMFKFLHALPRYAPGHKRENIRFIAVTEFYDLKAIDARTAFFVAGSDLVGPMGNELVPLATRDAAEDFLKEHRGKRILRFAEVTPDMLSRLDANRF